MASPLSKLTLAELYDKPKITPAVLREILKRDTFDTINGRYCDKVCALPCGAKNYDSLSIQEHSDAEVLILHDHPPIREKWKTTDQLASMHRAIYDYLIRKHFPKNTSYNVLDVMKCTPDPDYVKKKVTETTMLRCSAYLRRQIEIAKGRNLKAIITTSTVATKALGIKKSNYNDRGEVVIDPDIGVPVILTLHPKVTMMIRQNSSGKMWGPDYFEVIERDFKKANYLLRNQVKFPSLEQGIEKVARQIHVCTSLKEVDYYTRLIYNLPEGTIISWDLETTSLDPWSKDARILTTQYGWRNKETGEIESVVVPLWHKDNTFYNPNTAWSINHCLINAPDSPPKVGHNIKFDIKFAAVTKGVRATNVVADTMLLLHSINSGIVGNYGLKRAVWDFLPDTGLGGYEDLLEEEYKERKKREQEEAKAKEKVK